MPSDGEVARVLAILVLIFFHDAFFSRSRSGCFRASHEVSNTILIARWSEPCSVLSITHLTIESVKISEARARSIVDS